MPDDLSLERRDDGVLVVTLDRPDKLNALTIATFDAITRLCREAAADRSLRVVVLTGAGRAFCAGLDLVEAQTLPTLGPSDLVARQDRYSAAVQALHDLPVPVIAAVNGPAAGAGMSLALACDIRVAARDAWFSAAFVTIGLTGGDMGSSWFLPRLVGLGRAQEMLMTGRRVGADEALATGLVTSVVDSHDLLDTALGTAAALLANSPFGVRLTKQVVASNLGAATLAQAIDLENRNQVLAMGTRDMAEALDAFVSRRAPRFADE